MDSDYPKPLICQSRIDSFGTNLIFARDYVRNAIEPSKNSGVEETVEGLPMNSRSCRTVFRIFARDRRGKVASETKMAIDQIQS